MNAVLHFANCDSHREGGVCDCIQTLGFYQPDDFRSPVPSSLTEPALEFATAATDPLSGGHEACRSLSHSGIGALEFDDFDSQHCAEVALLTAREDY